jgi:hypothetical protein
MKLHFFYLQIFTEEKIKIFVTEKKEHRIYFDKISKRFEVLSTSVFNYVIFGFPKSNRKSIFGV